MASAMYDPSDQLEPSPTRCGSRNHVAAPAESNERCGEAPVEVNLCPNAGSSHI